MMGNAMEDTFKLELYNLASLTFHQIGLLFFYFMTICFVVYFFTALYMETYEISLKEGWVMIGLGLGFGILDLVVGDSRIFLPVWGLLAYLLVVDAKYQELPDKVNLMIAILALPVVIQSIMDVGFLKSTLMTGLVVFLIFLGISLVGALGGGDIKMMGAIGLYFPLIEIPQLLIFGFGVGVLHAITVLFKKDTNLKTMFAFGPGLIIGVLLTSLL